jgi:hypothetical protein
MAEYRLKDVLRPTAVAENADALSGMLVAGRVSSVRIALVIEVVDQTSKPPALGIFAEFVGIGTHGSLDGEHMLPKRFTRRVFVHERDGVGPGRKRGHDRWAWGADSQWVVGRELRVESRVLTAHGLLSVFHRCPETTLARPAPHTFARSRSRSPSTRIGFRSTCRSFAISRRCRSTRR